MAGKVIGIDLGTTYSCVSAMIDGNLKVFENSEGARITQKFLKTAKVQELLLLMLHLMRKTNQ